MRDGIAQCLEKLRHGDAYCTPSPDRRGGKIKFMASMLFLFVWVIGIWNLVLVIWNLNPMATPEHGRSQSSKRTVKVSAFFRASISLSLNGKAGGVQNILSNREYSIASFFICSKIQHPCLFRQVKMRVLTISKYHIFPYCFSPIKFYKCIMILMRFA